ncbi:MAG: response regulator [Thermodesulfobacteriota bacterium]
MGKKILVIDDEPDMVTFYTTVLEEKGYSVTGVNSAQEGLEFLQATRPDLILLDLIMPEKTGINLFRDLKKDERYKDIPVVLITGIKEVMGGDHKKFFEGLRTRVPAAYLEKPVDAKALLRTVGDILGPTA